MQFGIVVRRTEYSKTASFRSAIWVTAGLNPEESTDRLYRNLGKKLPLLSFVLNSGTLRKGPTNCLETSARHYRSSVFFGILEPWGRDQRAAPKRRQDITTTQFSLEFLNPEEGTDRLSRNLGKKLPLLPEEGTDKLSRNLGKKWPLLSFLLNSWTLRKGPICCPETSVRNDHYSVFFWILELWGRDRYVVPKPRQEITTTQFSSEFLNPEVGTDMLSRNHDKKLPLLSFLLNSWTLRKGPICCPETSVRNYHYSVFFWILEPWGRDRRVALKRR